jgi:hypothetical protein
VTLLAADPEAISALGVARRALEAGRRLAAVRRMRLLELRGSLPPRAALEDLLHRSIQFYNPHKERCVVRLDPVEPAPVLADEQVVLVFERGRPRWTAAERWWLHETGQRIEVYAGAAWALSFMAGADATAAAAALASLRSMTHGLFCNPNAQEHRLSDAHVPLPWLLPERRSPAGRKP